jgi:hypothetical protein
LEEEPGKTVGGFVEGVAFGLESDTMRLGTHYGEFLLSDIWAVTSWKLWRGRLPDDPFFP